MADLLVHEFGHQLTFETFWAVIRSTADRQQELLESIPRLEKFITTPELFSEGLFTAI